MKSLLEIAIGSPSGSPGPDPETSKAKAVATALAGYCPPRTFPGTRWKGIEDLHNDLAQVVDTAAVEIARWYKYPSSLRPDMDGKDWRLVIPDVSSRSVVVVNCHSLLHDGLWTLALTIFSTREVDQSKLKTIEHPDSGQRALLWSLAVAEGLAIQGYDYTPVIADFRRRLSK